MKLEMDLEKFFLQWPVSKMVQFDIGLLKDKSFKESLQTIGFLHSQYKKSVKFFATNSDLMDKEDIKKSVRFAHFDRSRA
jgi:hypothetical protein